MKKHVLFGAVLLTALSAVSQNRKPKTSSMIDTKMLLQTKYDDHHTVPSAATTSGNMPTSLPANSASKTNSIVWQNFTGSMNIYGSIISYCKPLQWNDELDAVTFVHRKSTTYDVSPPPASLAESGVMVAMVSTDCGTSWDSTAIYSNDSYWGRYPGGAIYNPIGNTNINNAYIVAAGPATGPGATTWIGNFYASKKLGTYDNIPSTVPGAQQAMPSEGPFEVGFLSRHDFAAYGFTATDDGKVRVLAGVSSVAEVDTAFMLITGTFNNGIFDWEGQVFDPPVTVSSIDNSENWVQRPIMAWNEAGNVGYLVVMGSRLGATGSNVGNQPIVYKTTNSGGTWSLEGSIDFNASGYDDLKNRLWAVSSDSTLVVPNFFWGEGIDATVDANDKLHIFSSLLAHPTEHPDSLNYISLWTSERYLWPHQPGYRPFLYDFIYDGTNPSPSWTHMLIDSMTTEGPAGVSGGRGYDDNPWDADPTASNQKVRVDARLQLSRTPDGKQILYSWSESDTLFTNFQRKWNTFPNVKARLFDVEDNMMSPSKVDLTDFSMEVSTRAMYHFISPKFKLVSRTNNSFDIVLPLTVSNSNPYAQTGPNVHWFACAPSTFQRVIINGIAQNTSRLLDNVAIFPNPATNQATAQVILTSSSTLQLNVLNAMGQLVKTSTAQGNTGENTLPIDLNGLVSGIYFVKIQSDNASTTKKLVIE